MINLKEFAKQMRENAVIKDGVVAASQELWYQIADLIDRLQTDYAPVVRCEDCRYYGNTKKHKRCGECTNYNRIAYPDEFCSYGERRKDRCLKC